MFSWLGFLWAKKNKEITTPIEDIPRPNESLQNELAGAIRLLTALAIREGGEVTVSTEFIAMAGDERFHAEFINNPDGSCTITVHHDLCE